jgi:hypothetical protein
MHNGKSGTESKVKCGQFFISMWLAYSLLVTNCNYSAIFGNYLQGTENGRVVTIVLVTCMLLK